MQAAEHCWPTGWLGTFQLAGPEFWQSAARLSSAPWPARLDAQVMTLPAWGAGPRSGLTRLRARSHPSCVAAATTPRRTSSSSPSAVRLGSGRGLPGLDEDYMALGEGHLNVACRYMRADRHHCPTCLMPGCRADGCEHEGQGARRQVQLVQREWPLACPLPSCLPCPPCLFPTHCWLGPSCKGHACTGSAWHSSLADLLPCPSFLARRGPLSLTCWTRLRAAAATPSCPSACPSWTATGEHSRARRPRQTQRA